MNSFWNKNYELFKERFPLLAENLKVMESSEITLEPAKNGSITGKSGNLMLHSKYNPEREAESLISAFNAESHENAVFLGFGLGYGPQVFASRNPSASLVLIEKDASRFFTALRASDWTPVFSHPKLILILEATENEAASVLNGLKADKTLIIKTKSQTAHNEEYFQNLESAIKKNIQKEEINTNTLEKFAKLWLSNSCRNIDFISTLDGVKKYEGLAKDLPFLILAAGPSLGKILPHLNELKKRSVIVCVDTALHACLKQSVEPDFIILTDPQYYCSLHLEFLSSPSSVLITEIAAYPSVFRFQCKETVLFSSLFPIGQFFEGKTSSKGKLAAGGSVTTSAWDFARLCGSRKIFIAGMDLGFPGKETHIRGSKFEENAHAQSTRTGNSESKNISTLFSASPSLAKDYNGNPLLTDKKMSLFSWWFENQCTSSKAQGTETYTLTPESLAIDGISTYPLADFLKLPKIEDKKVNFFNGAEAHKTQPVDKEEFKRIKFQFKRNLDELEAAAKKGIETATKAIKDRTKTPQSLQKLNEIDRFILESDAKDAASLVFPTKRQLDRLSKEIPQNTEIEKSLYPIQYSKLIYSQLLNSVKLFQKFFSRF